MCVPSSARPVTPSISIPLAAGVESLNVSVAAAVLLYEARRQRGAGRGGAPSRAGCDLSPLRWCGARADALPVRRLQPAPRGRPRRRARADRRARQLRRDERSARRRRLRRRRRGARAPGRSRCATRRTPTRCSSGSRQSTGTASASVSSRPTRRSAGRPGQEVRKVSSRTFLRDLEPRDARRGSGVTPARPARSGDAGEARAAPPRAVDGRPRSRRCKLLAVPNTCSNHRGKFAKGL